MRAAGASTCAASAFDIDLNVCTPAGVLSCCTHVFTIDPTGLPKEEVLQAGGQGHSDTGAAVDSGLLLRPFRFMKLRLDRVLKIELAGMPEEEVLQSGGKVPEFAPPQRWTAPYSAYAPGWWERFLPPAAK